MIASMSVSGPTFRMPTDKLDRAVKLCVDAADEVSHRLGWGHR